MVYIRAACFEGLLAGYRQYCYCSMCDEDVCEIIQSPYCVVGTEGMDHVIVNGRCVYEHMKLTGETSGRVLRLNR